MNTYRAKVSTLHDCNECDICTAATYGYTCTKNGSHVYGPHTIIINLNKRYKYVLYEHVGKKGDLYTLTQCRGICDKLAVITGYYAT